MQLVIISNMKPDTMLKIIFNKIWRQLILPLNAMGREGGIWPFFIELNRQVNEIPSCQIMVQIHLLHCSKEISLCPLFCFSRREVTSRLRALNRSIPLEYDKMTDPHKASKPSNTVALCYLPLNAFHNGFFSDLNLISVRIIVMNDFLWYWTGFELDINACYLTLFWNLKRVASPKSLT